MLRKYPKSQFKKRVLTGVKGIIAIEGLFMIASYGIWYRMNTSRDFRLYMHNNFNWVLRGYYKLGETLSASSSTRETDMSLWLQEGKLPKST